MSDPTYEKRREKEELWKEKRQMQEQLAKQGLTKEKAAYAFD